VIAAGWPACTAGEGPLAAFLGDSLTSGWRFPQGEAHPAVVARTLAARGRPIRVLNAGVSGDAAAQGLARLPAVLVVPVETNDGLGTRPLAETEAAIERILHEARPARARVVLVGVPAGAVRNWSKMAARRRATSPAPFRSKRHGP
jgi:acyl-CoA thioesterase-1